MNRCTRHSPSLWNPLQGCTACIMEASDATHRLAQAQIAGFDPSWSLEQHVAAKNHLEHNRASNVKVDFSGTNKAPEEASEANVTLSEAREQFHKQNKNHGYNEWQFTDWVFKTYDVRRKS